jgi:hypothetical protein
MGFKPSPDHSIERIDNSGPYSPENCRWATKYEQNRNRRSTHILSFGGRSMCIQDWEDDLGIKRGTLKRRYQAGWTVEDILTWPLHAKHPRRH